MNTDTKNANILALGFMVLFFLTPSPTSAGDAHIVFSKDGFGLPPVMTERLSPPAARDELETTIRRFVQNHPAWFPAQASQLHLDAILPHARGRTARFSQTMRGVRVRGASLAALVSGDGSLRVVSSSLTDVSSVDTRPRVSRAQASKLARSSARWFIPTQADVPVTTARLVIVPNVGADGGRLVWEVHLGRVDALLSNLRFYVDAHSGALLGSINLVQSAYDALAFETNPGSMFNRREPTLVQLGIPEGGIDYEELDASPAIVADIRTTCDRGARGAALCPEAPVWLRSPLHLARNCIDLHETKTMDLASGGLGVLEAHVCSEVQSAYASPETGFTCGDWKTPSGALDDTAPYDTFAEVNVFHHIDRAYRYFLELGAGGESEDDPWAGHLFRPLMATVNFKLPFATSIYASLMNPMTDEEALANITDPHGLLLPVDNAFFVPADEEGFPGIRRPYHTLVFGQGTFSDFSWDADIIVHEFTHSVDASATGGLYFKTYFADEWGLNPEPGALSEGYADLFAAFVTSDPTIGEYALEPMGPSLLRHLEGDASCPGSMRGEGHMDAQIWSQALWAARVAAVKAAAPDMEEAKATHRFERAAFAALTALVDNQGFEHASAATVAAVEDELGAQAASAVAEVLADRGVDRCVRVVSDEGSGRFARSSSVIAPGEIRLVTKPTPYTPGVMQYALTVGKGEACLTISFEQMRFATGAVSADPDIAFLVRKDAPITFSYEENAVIVDGDVHGPMDHLGQELSITAASGQSLPAGVYYVMPVNRGGGALLSELTISTDAPSGDHAAYALDFSPAEPQDSDGDDTGSDSGSDPDDTSWTETPTDSEDGGSDTGAADDTGTDAPSPGDHQARGKKGCGCAVAGRPPFPSLLNLLSSMR